MKKMTVIWEYLRGKLKMTGKCLRICFAVLAVLCVAALIASGSYEAPEEVRTYEYWTHDYVAEFMDIPVQDGQIVQKFTAGEGRLSQFIVQFDNYSPTDNATISVRLVDADGKEYYAWVVPVSALSGETFYLLANVDAQLQKGREYMIRVQLENGESGITLRGLSRKDHIDDIHPSVGEITIDGVGQEDAVVYLFQRYQAKTSYEVIWYAALAVTFLVLVALIWCKAPLWRILWEVLGAVLLALLSYYSAEVLSGNLYTIETQYALVNCLIVLGAYLLLKAVVGRVAFYLVALLTLLAAVTNFYVLQFKGAEFLLTDIQAFSTAMSVAGNYVFTFPPVLFTVILLYGCLILLQAAVDGSLKKPGIVTRIVCLAGVVAAAVLVNLSINTITFNYFTLSRNFGQFGWWYSNVCILKNLTMKRPADYSDRTIEGILSGVEEPEAQKTTAQNIIVIMNEALGDLSVIGELKTNRDYMPFIRSLSENTLKGNLHVSTFGGGTWITEYEFLTGISTRFMPTGSSPYCYFRGDQEEAGMTSTLKSQGYRTVAIHPYGPKNWNRDKVYSAMGFDAFISIDDFEDGEYIRNYISDKSCYDKIIACYEENRGEKLFLFNVTMQNHGGYDTNNGAVDKTITAQNADSGTVDTYLSLVYESDKAFEYLISYFSQVQEPTMIVMFGDHLPGLPESFYDTLYGKKESQRTEEEKSRKLITPYLIWTNYDADFAPLGDTSPNYFGRQVLHYAGVELPMYDRFVLQQRETVPVLGCYGIYDAQGQYVPYADVPEELLHSYKAMQYLRVEDRTSEYYSVFGLGK